MDFVHSVCQAGCWETPSVLADAVHRRRRREPSRCRAARSLVAWTTRRLPPAVVSPVPRPASPTDRAREEAEGEDPLSSEIRRPQRLISRFITPPNSHTPPLHPRPLRSVSLPSRAEHELPLSRSAAAKPLRGELSSASSPSNPTPPEHPQ